MINNADLFPQPSLVIFTKGTNNSDQVCTSVNKYNLNSRLAHFNALWMEHIHSFRTGIMAEYPVMSTS